MSRKKARVSREDDYLSHFFSNDDTGPTVLPDNLISKISLGALYDDYNDTTPHPSLRGRTREEIERLDEAVEATLHKLKEKGCFCDAAEGVVTEEYVRAPKNHRHASQRPPPEVLEDVAHRSWDAPLDRVPEKLHKQVVGIPAYQVVENTTAIEAFNTSLVPLTLDRLTADLQPCKALTLSAARDEDTCWFLVLSLDRTQDVFYVAVELKSQAPAAAALGRAQGLAKKANLGWDEVPAQVKSAPVEVAQHFYFTCDCDFVPS